uniref:Uncharacterized protein n=1 Tax=Arundo donax TaxID=35708 RepID=A0A0A8ZAM9_ARUDO
MTFFSSSAVHRNAGLFPASSFSSPSLALILLAASLLSLSG